MRQTSILEAAMSVLRLPAVALIFILVLASQTGTAQPYPTKPIRIVTVEPGGSADFVARLVALALSERLGQPVIVENRGGTGVLAIEIVAKAPADGYTLLSYSSTLWNLALLQRVSYDPVKDFAPITIAANSPNILVIGSTVPAASVKELIALAKAKPGTLNYGSGGTGSATHIAGELFKSMAGLDIVRVAYKGGAPALNALLAGQIQLFFATAASVAPHVKSNRLKALAVTSAQPSALAPGLPTVAASGLPGYESGAIYCVFAPARTSSAIIKRLNHDIVNVFQRTDVKEKFVAAGADIVASSPEQLAAVRKADMEKMRKLFKDAGFNTE
jgi:tripartite-type tricarboxylate transporter receptor subunit TctC